MKVLLDTSTLIAAMLPDHVHHAHALPWISQAKSNNYAETNLIDRAMIRHATLPILLVVQVFASALPLAWSGHRLALTKFQSRIQAETP